jgi:hypothetical protein
MKNLDTVAYTTAQCHKTMLLGKIKWLILLELQITIF